LYKKVNSETFFGGRQVLFLIFLVALLIRVIFVFTLKDGFYFADEFDYTLIARYFVEHGKLPESFDRSPLFPLFLAGLFKLGGESLFYIRIVQAALGAIITLQIVVIGRRVGGLGVGIVAGVLWAIYPMSTFMSGIFYPAILLTGLMTSAVLCLLPSAKNYAYTARVALAGLLLGAATLTKPMVFATIVVVAFWLFMQRRSGRLLLVSIFLGSALVALLPWTLHNVVKHGRLIPVESRSLEELVPWAEKSTARTIDGKRDQGQLTQAKGDSMPVTQLIQTTDDNAAVAQPSADNELVVMFTRMAKRYPGEFMSFFELYPNRVGFLAQSQRDKAHRKKTERFVRYIPFGSDLVMTVSILSVGPLYIFAIVGMVSMWRGREKRRELSLFVLIVMSFALSYAVSWGKIRYRVPVDPYIILLSAWGVVAFWNRVFKKGSTALTRQDSA
jgi:4-amino-4-deoxy-L-arabinose transferase-like glycosyltransferase